MRACVFVWRGDKGCGALCRTNESRAAAADLVTNAAGNLADRLDKMNLRLERENAQMRKALVALTEAVEELLPTVQDDLTRRRVQKAVSAARLAFSPNSRR